MSDFLPTGYELPKQNGNYLNKLPQGQTRIRILTNPVLGWIYFDRDNKPVRSIYANKPETFVNQGQNTRLKHSWTFIVWDYSDSKIKIWEPTQNGIQNDILDLHNNEVWGDPKTYDLVITRKGEGIETNYNIQPNPKTQVPEEALKEMQEANINLNELFVGGDPFNSSKQTQPPLPQEPPVQEMTTEERGLL